MNKCVDRTVLEMNRVSKSYGNKKILEDISLSINKGEIIGYLGPNGAGKTTTIRLMLGLIKQDMGIITRKTDRIGVVLDKEGLYEQLNPIENMNYLYYLYFGEKIPVEKARKILGKVQLLEHMDKKVGTFSKGMKKRLSLVCSLLCDPELLILDEPFTGLDPSGQKLIENLLLDLAQDRAVFLSSHNIPIVSNVCSRVIVLNKKILTDEKVVSKESGKLEKLYFDLLGDDK